MHRTLKLILLCLSYCLSGYSQSILIRPAINFGNSYNSLVTSSGGGISAKPVWAYSAGLAAEYKFKKRFAAGLALMYNQINYSFFFPYRDINVDFGEPIAERKYLEYYGYVSATAIKPLRLNIMKSDRLTVLPVVSIGTGVSFHKNRDGVYYRRERAYADIVKASLKFRTGDLTGFNIISKIGAKLYMHDTTEIVDISLCFNYGLNNLVYMDGYYSYPGNYTDFTLLFKGHYLFLSVSIPITVYRFKPKSKLMPVSE